MYKQLTFFLLTTDDGLAAAAADDLDFRKEEQRERERERERERMGVYTVKLIIKLPKYKYRVLYSNGFGVLDN